MKMAGDFFLFFIDRVVASSIAEDDEENKLLLEGLLEELGNIRGGGEGIILLSVPVPSPTEERADEEEPILPVE